MSREKIRNPTPPHPSFHYLLSHTIPFSLGPPTYRRTLDESDIPGIVGLPPFLPTTV